MAQGKPIFGGRNTNIGAFLTLLAMPTILTMFISGMWHGAGYTYILWGLLHGIYLCINHAWRLVRSRIWSNARIYNRRAAPFGFVLDVYFGRRGDGAVSGADGQRSGVAMEGDGGGLRYYPAPGGVLAPWLDRRLADLDRRAPGLDQRVPPDGSDNPYHPAAGDSPC